MAALTLEQGNKVTIGTLGMGKVLATTGGSPSSVLGRLLGVIAVAINSIEAHTGELNAHRRSDKVVPARLGTIRVLVGVAVVGNAAELGVGGLQLAGQTAKLILGCSIDGGLLDASLVAVAAVVDLANVEELILYGDILLKASTLVPVDLHLDVSQTFAPEAGQLAHLPEVLVLVAAVSVVDRAGIIRNSSKHGDESCVYL